MPRFSPMSRPARARHRGRQRLAQWQRAERASRATVAVKVAGHRPKFWKNRQAEAIFVVLREYGNRVICDTRVHFTDSSGRLVPSKMGLAITLDRLPQLVAALQKAKRMAKELGLLRDEAQP
jgi:hypothetical protein